MKAKRTDVNQIEIVKALRKIGCSVQDLSGVGRGCPDLMVARAGRVVLLEVKSKKGKLNKLQMEWRTKWQSIVHTVRSVDEAIAVMSLARAW